MREHAARVEPLSSVVVSLLRVGTRSCAFGASRRRADRSPRTARAVSVERPHKRSRRSNKKVPAAATMIVHGPSKLRRASQRQPESCRQ